MKIEGGSWKVGCRKLKWHRAWSAVALLTVLGAASEVRAQTLHPLVTNGPVEKRLNLVVLSEGYTTAQFGQFLTDATNLVARFLAGEPFAGYRSCFNAFAIAVASAESGSDHPSQAVWRNTYFNSTYDSYGVAEYLTLPPNDWNPDASKGTGRVTALLNSLMPQCTLPIVLVNDLLYGASGGSVLVCSRSTATRETLWHEAGHVLAGLGDEYEDPVPGFPDLEEPNTTRETRRDFVKWKAWIEPGTPVPTPPLWDYEDAVGLFEGAHYQTTGWFRPKLNCRMRDPSYPFCEVCQEALVKRFYEQVRPLDGFLPASTNLTLTTPGGRVFVVTPLPTPAGNVQVRWRLDGVSLEGQTNASLVLQPSALSNGIHMLRAEAFDATSKVRADPAGRLRQTVEWRLNVNLPWLQLATRSGVSAGSLRVSVIGVAPAGFVIQSSTDLAQWHDYSTQSLAGGSAEVMLPAGTSTGGRFYRARIVP